MSHLRKTRLMGTNNEDIESLKGALDIHQADVHNVLVNQYFHQHTGITTTLTTATNADGSSYILNVVSSTGFNVGKHLQIGVDNHQGLKHEILATTATTITLDSYVDQSFPIGTVIELVEIDMSVSGTLAAPEEFIIKPNPGQVIHIARILISMIHATAGDLGTFGGITGGITNGVLMRAYVNGQYQSLTNWKTNGDIKIDMYDVDFNTRSTGGGGGGLFGTTGRGSFNRVGAVIRLDGDAGDYIEIYVRDDLTALSSFSIKAQGHIEGV